MIPQEYLSNLGFLFVVMGAAALLELGVPLYAARGLPPGRRVANLAMTAQTLAFNFVLTAFASVAAGSTAESSTIGIAAAIGSVIAMDFAFGYFAHRAMHVVPLLWRFHRVHHSDPFVDVTTTYRTHPVESAWRYACLSVPIWVLGIPPAVVAGYRVLSAVNGVFEHANVRVPPALDSFVSRLWVTPNMHKIHHSRVQSETDTNYGNLFSLHDRVFGTFTSSTRAFGIRYGLGDTDGADGFAGLVAMPWRRDPAPLAGSPGVPQVGDRGSTVSPA